MELDLERWFAAEGWADFAARVSSLDSDSVAEASEYMRDIGPGIMAMLYDSNDDSSFKESRAADWLRSWFQAYGSKEFAAWEGHKQLGMTYKEVADLVTLWFKDEGLGHFYDDAKECAEDMASLTRDFIGRHGYCIMAYALGGYKFDQDIINFDFCVFKDSDVGIFLINWFSIIGYALFAQWLGREGYCTVALAVMAVRASNIPVWIDSVASQVA